MKEEDKLIDKFGRDTGFSVPDGYFEQVVETVMTNLPPYPEPARKVELSRWQRIKPYIYMAAMFAGIWLMMKIFVNVSPVGELNIENPPAHLAMAIQDAEISDPMFMVPAMADYELENEMSEAYSDIESFERDFAAENVGEAEDFDSDDDFEF